MEAWPSLQTKEFRDGVKVVAIDPSAPYASGIRRVLPQTGTVLDRSNADIPMPMWRALSFSGAVIVREWWGIAWG